MIRPAIRRAVRGAMKFAMDSNTPRYEQVATGNVVRAMADRVYLDASASGTSDTYNNTHQLAITGGTGSGQSGLINDYVVDSVTNELLYSEQFDNAYWTRQAVFPFGSGSVADAITSPFGTLTADFIVEDTTTDYHRISSSLLTVTSGVDSVVFVDIKLNGAPRRFVLNCSAIIGASACFEITSTGEIISSIGSAEIISLNDGWYRCIVIGKGTGISNRVYLQISPSNEISSVGSAYTGDGITGLYMTDAQLSYNSVVQEYIPTVATTVTETVRVAHVSSDFTTIPQGPADSTYAVNKILGVP